MGQSTRSKPYGNCKVLNDAGELIFRCDDKKAEWYLSRNLAVQVASNPRTIRLTFEPQGPGNKGDIFYLQDKENKCIVCGSQTELTRHHIVPHGYRKYFPEELKVHRGYDVALLCVPCHNTYERYAHELKKVIATKYGIAVDGKPAVVNKPALKARNAALTLLQHRPRIPQDRTEHLLDYLRAYFSKQDITEDDIVVASRLPAAVTRIEDQVLPGKYIVERLEDIAGFVKMWRQHFVTTMQPRHLPVGWGVEREV